MSTTYPTCVRHNIVDRIENKPIHWLAVSWAMLSGTACGNVELSCGIISVFFNPLVRARTHTHTHTHFISFLNTCYGINPPINGKYRNVYLKQDDIESRYPPWSSVSLSVAQNRNKCLLKKYLWWVSDPPGTDVRIRHIELAWYCWWKQFRVPETSGAALFCWYLEKQFLPSLIFWWSRERAVQMLAALPRVASLLTSGTALLFLSRKHITIDLSQTDAFYGYVQKFSLSNL